MSAREEMCDTHGCQRVATVFETTNGEPFRWCAPCWREILEQRREVHALVAAARLIECALKSERRS